MTTLYNDWNCSEELYRTIMLLGLGEINLFIDWSNWCNWYGRFFEKHKTDVCWLLGLLGFKKESKFTSLLLFPNFLSTIASETSLLPTKLEMWSINVLFMLILNWKETIGNETTLAYPNVDTS